MFQTFYCLCHYTACKKTTMIKINQFDIGGSGHRWTKWSGHQMINFSKVLHLIQVHLVSWSRNITLDLLNKTWHHFFQILYLLVSWVFLRPQIYSIIKYPNIFQLLLRNACKIYFLKIEVSTYKNKRNKHKTFYKKKIHLVLIWSLMYINRYAIWKYL